MPSGVTWMMVWGLGSGVEEPEEPEEPSGLAVDVTVMDWRVGVAVVVFAESAAMIAEMALWLCGQVIWLGGSL